MALWNTRAILLQNVYTQETSIQMLTMLGYVNRAAHVFDMKKSVGQTQGRGLVK